VEATVAIQVKVPATTANIGPGFDCLGAALTLYNQFWFEANPTGEALSITATGVNAERVSRSTDNMVYQAYVKLFQHCGKSPLPLKLRIEMQVPLARGLGSSATAIVGGLVGANQMAGQPLDLQAIADLATDIEGHPDNVVPALLGGCRLSASGLAQAWEVCPLVWHPDIVPVVAIPAFELSTAEARSVLPASYGRADAVFNTAHLGLLIRALESNHSGWLAAALQDRIHQPYREALIPGYQAVYKAAMAAGAHGLVISGAGPTLLALTDPSRSQPVAAAIAQAWEQAQIQAEVKILAIDPQGTQVS
jgi:homoserine kinase